MAEAAVNVENYSPVRKEELAKIQKRFCCSTDQSKYFYIAKNGRIINIRDVNIYCLQNVQIDLEIAGGRDTRLWQILEGEINRRKQTAGKT